MAYASHFITGVIAGLGMSLIGWPFATLTAWVGVRQTVEWLNRNVFNKKDWLNQQDTPSRDMMDHMAGLTVGLVGGACIRLFVPGWVSTWSFYP